MDSLEQGLRKGGHYVLYGEVKMPTGDSPCDHLERAIWSSNISPEDRLVLVARLKAVRREVEMLSARVDHQESDLR